jgi:hypothetical protein
MTIRSELETVLGTFCTANNIARSIEGKPFDRSKVTEYVQLFFLDSSTTNPNVEFSRKRIRGMIQINICCPDGQGSKRVEELAQMVADLYPADNKQAFATVSIEQHPQIGRAMIDANFRVVPVTVSYRQES